MSLFKNIIGDALGEDFGKNLGDAINKASQQVKEPAATDCGSKQPEPCQEEGKETSKKTNNSAAANNIENVFASLKQTMEGYATEVSKNIKVCPNCETPNGADKKFCTSCGAKLPEETLAQGTLCPKCGKQNPVGTKFCSDCGEKLPAVELEEKAAATKDAKTLQQWQEKLPQYPVWECGGSDFSIEDYDSFYAFNVYMGTRFAADMAIRQYRDVLMQNGFRQAGEYPSIGNLYKMVDGKCYHVDTDHCFEGDEDRPSIYFNIEEPAGGFNYVKPEPQKATGLKDLFKF